MARAGRQASAGDMIRSLLVILVPLVVITIIFTSVPKQHPVKTVDWQPVLAPARKQAPFPVLAPTNLPDGWRATQASWVPLGRPGLNGDPSVRNLWQLGFLSPDDTFVGLDQGDEQPQQLIDAETRKGAADGTSTVGAATWTRMVSSDGRTRSLVQSTASVTTIVAGDLPYEALEAYASTLSDGR